MLLLKKYERYFRDRHNALAARIAFSGDDMTCGHCADTIQKAIETTLPGTTVDADPASKLVNVTGFSDYAAIKAIVTGAGYTPSAAPVAA